MADGQMGIMDGGEGRTLTVTKEYRTDGVEERKLTYSLRRRTTPADDGDDDVLRRLSAEHRAFELTLLDITEKAVAKLKQCGKDVSGFDKSQPTTESMFWLLNQLARVKQERQKQREKDAMKKLTEADYLRLRRSIQLVLLINTQLRETRLLNQELQLQCADKKYREEAAAEMAKIEAVVKDLRRQFRYVDEVKPKESLDELLETTEQEMTLTEHQIYMLRIFAQELFPLEDFERELIMMAEKIKEVRQHVNIAKTPVASPSALTNVVTTTVEMPSVSKTVSVEEPTSSIATAASKDSGAPKTTTEPTPAPTTSKSIPTPAKKPEEPASPKSKTPSKTASSSAARRPKEASTKGIRSSKSASKDKDAPPPPPKAIVKPPTVSVKKPVEQPKANTKRTPATGKTAPKAQNKSAGRNASQRSKTAGKTGTASVKKAEMKPPSKTTGAKNVKSSKSRSQKGQQKPPRSAKSAKKPTKKPTASSKSKKP